MNTSNPVLNDKSFQGTLVNSGESMTLSGTINKTFLLLCAVALSAAWTWSLYLKNGSDAVTPWLLLGGVGGLILALITVFKKEWSPVTAPAYSILEGLTLGAISAMYNQRFQGIALQAVGITLAVAFALLAAYKSGLIRVTDNFRLGVFAATAGVGLLYLATFILGFFGVHVPYIHDNTPYGILFSLVVVAIAAMNLVLDFDFVETAVERGAPKYMEWYAAFGLLVTLVWLYLEIIRLLAKSRSRRD